jgi:hypothetical protein
MNGSGARSADRSGSLAGELGRARKRTAGAVGRPIMVSRRPYPLRIERRAKVAPVLIPFRTPTVLTSGLDDYPRAVPPHLGELHVDLASWMGFFSRTMRDVAEFLGEEEDLEDFEEQHDAIVGNIEDLHWSEEEQMYCDASVDEDGALFLALPINALTSAKVTDTLALRSDESYHVCHRGYVSLFPFLLSLLPVDSSHLGATLELLRDPEQLWSPYGLRSLSKNHPLFGQGENYWRGPIWIQMNYLALAALNQVRQRFSDDPDSAVLMVHALLSAEIRERSGTVPDSGCRDLRRAEEQRHQQRL